MLRLAEQEKSLLLSTQPPQPFPLTEVQQAYWVGRNADLPLGGISTHYYYEIEATDLNLPQLEAALNRLIKHHEMLRAIILPDGTQQILEDAPQYAIAKIDLRKTAPGTAERTLLRVRDELSHQVLPCDRWPLFDIRACMLPERKTRLFISFDALVLDERSRNTFFLQWQQLYLNPYGSLPQPKSSFRDFVLAEVSHRKSEDYAVAKQYWESQIPTLPPSPALPLTTKLERVLEPKYSHLDVILPEDKWSELKRKAQERKITVTPVLLSAFADTLRQWSKQSNFTINVTLFSKLAQDPCFRDVLGDYTSSLLMPIENQIHMTFEERAAEIRKRLRENLSHSSFSGVNVIREILRREGNEIRPIMPVVFTSLVSTDPRHREQDPLAWLGKTVVSVTQTPQVILDNQVRERGGELHIAWDFISEVFPEGMVEDLFQAFTSHIARLATEEAAWSEPFQDLSRQLLPASDRKLSETTNTTRAPHTARVLHEPFFENAIKDPTRPAVISLERSLSYGELKVEAERVAQWLVQHGAKPGSMVAIVMEKGWEQVAAAIGVLLAGAAYLPLDPLLPRERLWLLLEDAKVDHILTQPCVDTVVEWPDGPERCCVATGSKNGTTPVSMPQPDPQSLAYVIYTSGSTGRPKGVMMDHAAAYNTIVDINRRFSIGPEDRVFALSSLSFDLSVYDIFGTLAAGATIVLPDPGGISDPAHWSDMVREQGVTVWDSVPALAELLVDYREGQQREPLSSVRLVMMSGDWIPVSLPERIRALSSSVRIVSLGGATEAGIWSIFFDIESVDPNWNSIPYGKPLANQSFWVLNDALEECPVWVTGEIYIGGDSLAQGYWGDEIKTATRFLTHPRTCERIYRTGDLGRRHPDGSIEILGRDDSQVKIRGYRIELKEIEAALKLHSAVNEVIVKAEKIRGGSHLVAYVVPKRQGATSDVGREDDRGGYSLPDLLRDFLLETLPRYMVPSHFVILQSGLPLNENGKIDRKALPVPDVLNDLVTSDVAASDSNAKAIQDLIIEVTGAPISDGEANLLHHGATSLDLIRIIAGMERKFGVRPLSHEFFRNPTLASLKALIPTISNSG